MAERSHCSEPTNAQKPTFDKWLFSLTDLTAPRTLSFWTQPELLSLKSGEEAEDGGNAGDCWLANRMTESPEACNFGTRVALLAGSISSRAGWIERLGPWSSLSRGTLKWAFCFAKQPDLEPGRLTAVNKVEDCHRRICRYTCNLRYIRPCLVESPSLLRVWSCPKIESGPRVTTQITVKPTHSYPALRRETRTSLLFDFYRVKTKLWTCAWSNSNPGPCSFYPD
jgi:hypothetical protein